MCDFQKCESVEELLDMWKNKYSTSIKLFIKDGIICHEEYSEPHVLFIMRDMNTGTEVDLREELRQWGSGWKTWNNAARWAHALLTGDNIYPHEIDRCAEMRKVAVINIKKEAGGSRAFKKELQEAATQYGTYTLREIELCDPKIIICGGFGNATILKDHIFKDLAGDWLEISSDEFNCTWWYYFATINGRQVPVINFCHPQVTHFKGKRGHNDLFAPLYRDMLNFRKFFNIE